MWQQAIDRVIAVGPAFWDVLAEMSPYLLFGFLVAGILSVFIGARLVARHLGGRGFSSILKASVFGVPLPLCSCGVIPVAASLRRSGASRGATTSFLLSTPQTGVDSILVTYSLLGPVFAVFRPVAALATGLLGGSIISALTKKEDDEKHGHELDEGASYSMEGECGCESTTEALEPPSGNRFVRALHYGFVTLPGDIARALIIGLIVAGVISALIPEDFFASYLGAGIVPMLVMMAVGLPVYVCATASVPVAAALIMTGVSPGAALVFLMTGPATNAAAVSTIWRIMGRKTAVLYLLTVAVAALASGLVLDYVFQVSGASAAMHHHEMLPGWLKNGSALVLLAVLGYGVVRPRLARPAKTEAEAAPGALTIQVDGMRCSHCTGAVRDALASMPGVKEAEVDLESGQARVRGEGLSIESLCRTIRELGYEPRVEGAGAAACAGE